MKIQIYYVFFVKTVTLHLSKGKDFFVRSSRILLIKDIVVFVIGG